MVLWANSELKCITVLEDFVFGLLVIFHSSRYDGLFRFLLLLRRAQIALQQIWALLMQYRRKVEELRPVWELRTHMGFLVDNLQYYVQVSVCVCVCVCVCL